MTRIGQESLIAHCIVVVLHFCSQLILVHNQDDGLGGPMALT